MQAISKSPSSLLIARSVRSFVSSAARSQAVPTEKPTHPKEFKIYRWVCPYTPKHTSHSNPSKQNPDEPATPPKLQSYTIDLNQCGPMVSRAPSLPEEPSVTETSPTDSRRVDKNQKRSRPHTHLQKVLQRGYLWIVRHEHKRTEYSCVPLPN